MVIYEVNVTVEADVANEYSAWLREHIREMLQIDGFEAAAWYLRDPDADAEKEQDPADGPLGDRRWTIHYHLRDRAALKAYLSEHAERMRGEGTSRFEGRFTADRRVLEKKRVFSDAAASRDGDVHDVEK